MNKNQLSVLTGEVLRDLARNESVTREIRKAAVELLVEKNHPFANHPEFALYVLDIKAAQAAKTEVQELVAAQVEEDLPVVHPVEDVKDVKDSSENEPALTIEYGNLDVEKPQAEKILEDAVNMYFGEPALKASVTTKTMFGGE